MTFLKTLALVSLLAVAAYAVDEEPPTPKKPTTPPPGAKTGAGADIKMPTEEGEGEEKPPAEGEKMMKCPDMKGFKFKGTMDAGMGVWYDGKFDPKMEEMTGENKKKDGEEEKEKKGGRKLLDDDDDEKKEGGEEVDMEGLIPKTEFTTIEDFTITIMEQEGEDKCFMFGSVEYFDKTRDEDVVLWWSGIAGASSTSSEMMLIGKTGQAICYIRFSPDMKEMFVTSHTLGLPRAMKEEMMPMMKDKMEGGDKGEMMSKMWMLKDSFFMLHRGHLMMVEE